MSKRASGAVSAARTEKWFEPGEWIGPSVGGRPQRSNRTSKASSAGTCTAPSSVVLNKNGREWAASSGGTENHTFVLTHSEQRGATLGGPPIDRYGRA